MVEHRLVCLALERAKELRDEAVREHRVRELLGEGPGLARYYAPLLDWLGHKLVEVGLNLRAKYGSLDTLVSEPAGELQ